MTKQEPTRIELQAETIAKMLYIKGCVPLAMLEDCEKLIADGLKQFSTAMQPASPSCALREALEKERSYKDAAYAERNKIVRLLASLYPSGIKKTEIEGWDEDWHWCVYINLPNGQASWHFHVDDLPMFKTFPPYSGEWDGHTTDEKYAKILELALAQAPVPMPVSGEAV